MNLIILIKLFHSESRKEVTFLNKGITIIIFFVFWTVIFAYNITMNCTIKIEVVVHSEFVFDSSLVVVVIVVVVVVGFGVDRVYGHALLIKTIVFKFSKLFISDTRTTFERIWIRFNRTNVKTFI